MSSAWDRQLKRKVLTGVAPQANRIGLSPVGVLTPPEPEQIVKRLQPRWGFTHWERGWIHGTWYCGTKYKPSSYWGQFPGQFVERVHAMFPVERMLHVCSGHAHLAGAVNIDIQPVPSVDVQADAEHLPFAGNSFAVALIDPPYSEEDSQRYGVKRLIRSTTTMTEIRRVLVPGGYLLWLDERYPMYRRGVWELVGLIGIITGFERRARVLSIFRKPLTEPNFYDTKGESNE